MNPLRLIGYVGIFLLLIVDLFGMFSAFLHHDWYGLFVTTAFLGLLGFLAYSLWAAAQRERLPELKATRDLGWFGESFSAFFRGPVLHTPEGWLLIVGSSLSVFFAALAWLAPSFIALNPARSSINATMFGMWPILSFVLYVKFCAPHFRPRLYTFLVMLLINGFPFYQAYK